MADEADCGEPATTGFDFFAERVEKAAVERALELDHVYEALRHPRRRYLCHALVEDTEWSLADLATKVTAWENDIPEHAVTAEQRQSVHVSLYHRHIPGLVEEGVVTFDEASGTIAAGPTAHQVLAALEGVGTSLDATQEVRGEMDESDRGE